MDENAQAIAAFLDTWLPEFERSVEMFTTQRVKAERGVPEKTGSSTGSTGFVLWQGQTFEQKQSGSVWIGTPVETCTTLTQAVAEDSAAGESLYRELLEQSFASTAEVFRSDSQSKLVCGRAIKNAAPPDLASVETVWLTLPNGERAAIRVGFEPEFTALFAQDKHRSEIFADPRTASGLPQSLECLTDLELPVAVVLGRAKVRVREALKLTAGSLIELDRRVNDPVEIIVHNVVVARGEVVSVKGNYGVRIQEVSSARERQALQASASRSSLARLQSAVSNMASTGVIA